MISVLYETTDNLRMIPTQLYVCKMYSEDSKEIFNIYFQEVYCFIPGRHIVSVIYSVPRCSKITYKISSLSPVMLSLHLDCIILENRSLALSIMYLLYLYTVIMQSP